MFSGWRPKADIGPGLATRVPAIIAVGRVTVNRPDIADPALCLIVFKSNRDAGLVLFAAIVLDGLVRQGW